MKKFINIALCLSVISGVIPMGASAKSQPMTIENGTDHWEMTSISGDINSDGKVSVADALLLQKCFMDKYDYMNGDFDKYKLDVNFDGCFDSFDLVQIRKLVLNPEQAEKQIFAVDIINTDAEIPSFEEKYDEWRYGENLRSIITSYDEMSTYLENLIADSDELNKYLEKYDESFFEDNNLFLEPFIQERGNGIFTQIATTVRLNNYGDTVACLMGSAYAQDRGLYPVTNIKMLAQIAIPKSMTSAEDKFMYADMSYILAGQKETVSYSDGDHEIIITQTLDWGNNANVYIKEGDSFIYVASIYPDFLFQDGELNTDYKITFCNDAFVIDYKSEFNEWEKLQVSYDGEDIVNFSDPVYSSPDGETKLYTNFRYFSSNNGGATANETLIDFYMEESDGYLKQICTLTAEGYNSPFKKEGEWSVDSDGNSVFGNGETYSLTWLENSVIVDYHYYGEQWAKSEINFDGSSTDILYYWK